MKEITAKDWENIDFRKKKYIQLRQTLDGLITGRCAKVSSFVKDENGMCSEERIKKLVEDLTHAMDEYGIRENLWPVSEELSVDDIDNDVTAHIPQQFCEFVYDYLYCMIKLIVSDMEWVEKMYESPFEDTFQQIYVHSVEMRKLASQPAAARWAALWEEVKYGVLGDENVFDIFIMAYEALSGHGISESLSVVMKEGLDTYCEDLEQSYNELMESIRGSEMTPEEYGNEVSKENDENDEKNDGAAQNDDDVDYFADLEELEHRWDLIETNFVDTFESSDIYCEKCANFREIFYAGKYGYLLSIFDELVDGMLDVFLCKTDLSLYSDVNSFVRAYMMLEKQLAPIRHIAKEV